MNMANNMGSRSEYDCTKQTNRLLNEQCLSSHTLLTMIAKMAKKHRNATITIILFEKWTNT